MAARIPGTEGQINYHLTEIGSENKKFLLKYTSSYQTSRLREVAWTEMFFKICSCVRTRVSFSTEFQVLKVKIKGMSFFRLLKNEIVHFFLITPKLRKDEKRPDIIDDCSANQIAAFSSVC